MTEQKLFFIDIDTDKVTVTEKEKLALNVEQQEIIDRSNYLLQLENAGLDNWTHVNYTNFCEKCKNQKLELGSQDYHEPDPDEDCKGVCNMCLLKQELSTLTKKEIINREIRLFISDLVDRYNISEMHVKIDFSTGDD